uniref:(northern house mosquito) hypothetical protein n=1 Tax=Culex pipiens TaxID=7175 RepID=A0A8D8JN84_CULPI
MRTGSARFSARKITAKTSEINLRSKTCTRCRCRTTQFSVTASTSTTKLPSRRSASLGTSAAGWDCGPRRAKLTEKQRPKPTVSKKITFCAIWASACSGGNCTPKPWSASSRSAKPPTRPRSERRWRTSRPASIRNRTPSTKAHLTGWPHRTWRRPTC